MSKKDQIRASLKNIETGDPEPIAVVNEAKYIQHNPQTHEGSERLAALFALLSKTNPRVHLRTVTISLATPNIILHRGASGSKCSVLKTAKPLNTGTTFNHDTAQIHQATAWWRAQRKRRIWIEAAIAARSFGRFWKRF